MRKRALLLLMSLVLIVSVILSAKSVSYAGGPTDEILNYTITVDVNEDATLDMNYHIDWKVLQSGGSLGPVSWVEIGIPNGHCSDLTAQTDNIKKIALSKKSGEVLVRIDFDKSYYEGCGSARACSRSSANSVRQVPAHSQAPYRDYWYEREL